MLSLIKDCQKRIRRCLKIIANERVPGVRLTMLQIWTKQNRQNDYFAQYEEIADQLHRVQHDSMQSLVGNQANNENEEEPKEEKLDAINLRPTLRGYSSKNFIKGGDGTQIRECSFVRMVLRTNASAKDVKQKTLIAQIIWNMLLRSIDKRHADQHRMAISANQEIFSLIASSMTKSVDLMFGVYDLYKSIWRYSQPPFVDQNLALRLERNLCGNQKRIDDAVKKLKTEFNNNKPIFCSF